MSSGRSYGASALSQAYSTVPYTHDGRTLVDLRGVVRQMTTAHDEVDVDATCFLEHVAWRTVSLP